MTTIRELDPQTVERIAAGEVVERPASVVKELVENAIDADASRVEVAVEAGGTESIRVSDDGVGMTEAAVQRAIEEHTTSKIETIDDLEAGVSTLGFRGEALHAIGAVSRLTITTRPREAAGDADRATELTVEGGDVTAVRPAGRPPGTTVEVADLFYNVPARRKYLKQESTEFAHVNTVVTSYALANPDVAVSLEHDGRETFATPGQGDLRETIMAVYGGEVARSMIAVEPGDVPDGPLEGVSGLVSHPETNRAGREYLSTYVDGRYVRSSAVREAVVDAYGTQLAPDRYPFAVLFLDVPPGDVDVNVHPRKMEVRFASEDGVREQVRGAVENALLREGLIRSSAPRGRSAPEQTEIAPERDTSDDERADGRDEGPDSDDPGTAPEEARRVPSVDPDGSPADSSGRSPGDSPADSPADSSADSPDDSPADDAVENPHASTASDAGTTTDDSLDPSASGDLASTSDDPHRRRSRISGGHDQARLADDDPPEFDSLPSMRVLGQFDDTYVVAETPDGLALIDQHAADERINYERLKAAFEGETTTQALADPVELELTAREAAVFEDRADALARIGFNAVRTGDRTVEVRTVPGIVAGTAGPELLRDALSAVVAGEDAAAETVEAAADELLADLACYPSVTGNTSLTEGSVRDLLVALDDCENPWACPHGRPVLIRIDSEEIDDRFERDYPGHP
ncbi:MAG: DNA mismatch repair endonuclease MutL [Haloarculaceae archaeon]